MVTVASGSPFMSVVRYSSWVAVNFCGIRPEERHLDVAAAQHGARRGVLEALRRLVERIVGGQLWTDAPHDLLVRDGTDPLGTGGRCSIAQVHPVSIA